MATQSTPLPPPPVPAELKTQNPELETVQPTMEGPGDANSEATKDNSPTSVFVNSEPMREEQVQNAVKFLSHPKVRGSPVMYRRSFLEKKGLTKEEIDESFRRVPDPPSTVSSGQSTDTSKDGQLKSSPIIQPQTQTQSMQPAAAPPSGVISKVGIFSPSRFHWSHALLAVGFLAVSGAGTAVFFKNAIVPRLKSWIRKVVSEEEEEPSNETDSKPSLGEETAAAAKAAAAAAADAARASQDMLISKTEDKRYFEELMKLLVVQVQEIKSMSNCIKKLEGQSSSAVRSAYVEQEDHRISVTSSRQSNANGKAEFGLRAVRSVSPPASAVSPVAPHPKSYMEPWGVGHTSHSSNYALQSQEDNGLNYDMLNDGPISKSNVNSLPWSQPKNARIMEFETEDEPKTGFSGGPTTSEQPPVQRSWVPPQPPPFAMPEAVAAIRQPKKSLFTTEQSNDQLVAHSSYETDELQRITKISELGGSVEVNGGSSKPNTSEIQEEDEAAE